MGRLKRRRTGRYEFRIAPEQMERFRTYSGKKSVGAWLRDLGEKEIDRLQRKARRDSHKPSRDVAREKMIRDAYPHLHVCPEGLWCEECGRIG